MWLKNEESKAQYARNIFVGLDSETKKIGSMPWKETFFC